MVNTTAAVLSLQIEVDNLQSRLNSLTVTANGISSGNDDMWVLTSGILVFFMQAGFAMLEAGSVRSKNAVNIMYKNLIDGAISAVCFWIIGYAFAYGHDVDGLAGDSKFALSSSEFDIDETDNSNYHSFFFQWAFAATATTIVSGCVAERCTVHAYFVYSAVISGLIYPVVAHWVWGNGWLSPFAPDDQTYLFRGRESNNFIDFAGSGVVHAVGGIAGLVATMMLGPRLGRFDAEGKPQPIQGHSSVLVVLGTLILWVGWYGFNAGSTLCITGDCSKLASKVAVVTTIAAASSALTMVLYQATVLRSFDLSAVCNAVLAGLVAITAPCAVVEPWGAWLIGVAACILYVTASKALLYFHVDDPLDASSVHGACGIWGVLAVGIFGNDDNAAFAGYNGSANGHHPFRTGEQFGVQLVGILAIIIWVLGTTTILFLFITNFVGFRVPFEVEVVGLDTNEHGSNCYILYDTIGTTVATGTTADKFAATVTDHAPGSGSRSTPAMPSTPVARGGGGGGGGFDGWDQATRDNHSDSNQSLQRTVHLHTQQSRRIDLANMGHVYRLNRSSRSGIYGFGLDKKPVPQSGSSPSPAPPGDQLDSLDSPSSERRGKRLFRHQDQETPCPSAATGGENPSTGSGDGATASNPNAPGGASMPTGVDADATGAFRSAGAELEIDAGEEGVSDSNNSKRRGSLLSRLASLGGNNSPIASSPSAAGSRSIGHKRESAEISFAEMFEDREHSSASYTIPPHQQASIRLNSPESRVNRLNQPKTFKY